MYARTTAVFFHVLHFMPQLILLLPLEMTKADDGDEVFQRLVGNIKILKHLAWRLWSSSKAIVATHLPTNGDQMRTNCDRGSLNDRSGIEPNGQINGHLL